MDQGRSSHPTGVADEAVLKPVSTLFGPKSLADGRRKKRCLAQYHGLQEVERKLKVTHVMRARSRAPFKHRGFISDRIRSIRKYW